MHRIDNSTAAAVLPTPSAAGTPGYWTAGNPVSGTPATVISPDWMNAVQEELTTVITAGGVVPSKTNNTQLLTALGSIFGGGGTLSATGWQKLPGGLILQWSSVTIPTSTSIIWTYPVAFTSGVFGVFATTRATATSTEVVGVVGTPSLTQAQIDTLPGGAIVAAYVVALGV